MQPLNESRLNSDTQTCARIYVQEQLRQARLLHQIDKTATGLKNAFTICVTSLAVLLLFAKAFPHAKLDASRTIAPVLSSKLAAANSNKTRTLAAIGREQGGRVDDQRINDATDVDGKR